MKPLRISSHFLSFTDTKQKPHTARIDLPICHVQCIAHDQKLLQGPLCYIAGLVLGCSNPKFQISLHDHSVANVLKVQTLYFTLRKCTLNARLGSNVSNWRAWSPGPACSHAVRLARGPLMHVMLMRGDGGYLVPNIGEERCSIADLANSSSALYTAYREIYQNWTEHADWFK